MIEIDVNYMAVLVAAIASMVIGMAWYSKTLFGGVWMQLSGTTEKDMQKAKQKGVTKQIAGQFIATLVTAYVLAHFVRYVNAMSWTDGVQAGFWIWLGFIAPMMLGIVL